jgi:hypothetical protein
MNTTAVGQVTINGFFYFDCGGYSCCPTLSGGKRLSAFQR